MQYVRVDSAFVAQTLENIALNFDHAQAQFLFLFVRFEHLQHVLGGVVAVHVQGVQVAVHTHVEHVLFRNAVDDFLGGVDASTNLLDGVEGLSNHGADCFVHFFFFAVVDRQVRPADHGGQQHALHDHGAQHHAGHHEDHEVAVFNTCRDGQRHRQGHAAAQTRHSGEDAAAVGVAHSALLFAAVQKMNHENVDLQEYVTNGNAGNPGDQHNEQAVAPGGAVEVNGDAHTFHGGGQLYTDHDEQHGVHDEGDERPGGQTVGAVLRADSFRAVVGKEERRNHDSNHAGALHIGERLDLLREQERDEGHGQHEAGEPHRVIDVGTNLVGYPADRQADQNTDEEGEEEHAAGVAEGQSLTGGYLQREGQQHEGRAVVDECLRLEGGDGGLGQFTVEGCDSDGVGGCERHTDEQCRTPGAHAGELVQNPGDAEGGHDDQQGSGEDNAADAVARFTP